MNKILRLYFALSILSPAQAQNPEAVPLIPSGINTALGAVREGATVEETVKAMRKFYPEAKMMDIVVWSIGNGVISINLEVGLEVSFSVSQRPKEIDWRVGNISSFGISDYKKHKYIKIESKPILPVKDKNAEQDGTGQPATAPESKSEGGDKSQPESEGRSR